MTGQKDGGNPRAGQYLRLIEYVSRLGLPETFVVISGSNEECGGSDWMGFTLGGRAFLLDVMLIENRTGAPVTIDELLGAEIAASTLRPLTGSDAPDDQAASILLKRTLRPGQRLVVPIRILARATSYEQRTPNILQNAVELYRSVRAAPAGHVFTEQLDGLDGRNFTLRKTKESFGAPSLPTQADFVYGPELKVSGMRVDGERAVFEGRSANFLNMTAEQRAGSCPILYVKDAASSDWLRIGKVLHEARTQSRRMTQRVVLTGLRTSFRLAEEELETAFIEDIALVIVRYDGSRIALVPPSGFAADSGPKILTMSDYLDISFELPPEINAKDIVRTELSVTGYYTRYADDLLLTARSATPILRKLAPVAAKGR